MTTPLPPSGGAPAASSPPSRASAGVVRAYRVVRWAPAVVAVVYAVLLVASFRRLAQAFAWNSDFVSPLVISETIGAAGLSETVLGTFGPYSTILVNVATHDLPWSRGVWQAWPLTVALAGVALLAACSWRLAGRWAAVTTVAIGVAVSTPVLSAYVAPANRNLLLFCQALLAAFLLLLGRRPGLPVPALVAAAALVGAVVGVNVASDPLVAVTGLAPFAGAGLVLALRWRGPQSRRLAAVVGGTTAVAVAGWALTAAVSRSAGFSTLGASRDRVPLAAPDEAFGNLERLGRGVMALGSGDVLGTPVDAGWFAALASGLVVLVALLVPLGLGASALRQPRGGRPDGDAGRTLYLLFWGLTVAILVVAFLATDVAAQTEVGTVRYLPAVLFALAAAVPVWAARTPRRQATTGALAALVAVMATISLANNQIAESAEALPWARASEGILRLAEARGVERGYASYSEASPLSWASEGELRVSPVLPCATATGAPTLCPFVANVAASWYEPARRGPSLLVVSPPLPFALPPEPAEIFGPPTASVRVGPITEVFIYPYDIGTRFATLGFPDPDPGAP